MKFSFALPTSAVLARSCWLEWPPALAAGPSAAVPRDAALEKRMLDHANSAPILRDKGTSLGAAAAGTVAAAAGFGAYPTRPGVILVTPDPYTASKGVVSIPTGHAAIIWSTKSVVESLDVGVVKRPNDWSSSKQQVYGLTVRGTTVAQDNAASNWAYAQIGKPYLWPWESNWQGYFQTWRRDKFYCSHLVWAAFKDKFGIDLSTPDFGGYS